MRRAKNEKNRTITPLRGSLSRLLYRNVVKMTTLLARFMLILMFLVATALAQVQSHRLSETRVIDTNLEMGVYNLTANQVNVTTDVCITGGNCLSSAGGRYLGNTAATGNASLGDWAAAGAEVGYVAGDTICSSEYSGSHLCSFDEIHASISSTDISGWTGEAWMSSGPAKYSPADLPVTDCNGFTHGTPDSYLGNWWLFDSTSGGKGRTGHCGNVLPLACCI